MRSGLNEESNEDSPMPEQCRSFYSELMPLLCCGYLKLVCSTLKLLNTTLLMSSLWLRFAFVQIGIVPHLLSVLDLESDEPATDEVLHLFLEIVANCLLVLSDAHLWDPSFPMSVAKSEAVECGLQQLMRPLTPFMTFVLRNVIPLSTSSPAVSQTTIRLLFAILRVLPLFETDCDLVDCEEVVMTAMQALSLVECESGIEDFFSNVSTIVRQMDQSSDEHTALNESRIVDGLLSEGLLNEIEMRLVLTSDANYPPYMVTLTRNAGKLLGQNLPNRC
ncbi:hypothetical protein BLNAU_16673 [Blattamonas nauphoetae]|uniref:Uncharacterized protein n=1 Tax=Blattamonas nauphoetae TaxID=2049346 RepID=A0ABQ9X898_9EUKA|nr:hypothetical protein BLNAU_16673 [Blattamonas nauphoetae]